MPSVVNCCVMVSVTFFIVMLSVLMPSDIMQSVFVLCPLISILQSGVKPSVSTLSVGA